MKGGGCRFSHSGLNLHKCVSSVNIIRTDTTNFPVLERQVLETSYLSCYVLKSSNLRHYEKIFFLFQFLSLFFLRTAAQRKWQMVGDYRIINIPGFYY